MNFGSIGLHDIELPVTLRCAAPAFDDLLLRISEQHRPCKIERNNRGEITIMTPVGGIGDTHKLFVASALLRWTEEQGAGIAFGSSVGFNLPDSSCLSPDAAWLSLSRWNALTPEQQAAFRLSASTSSLKCAPAPIHGIRWTKRCFCGWKTEPNSLGCSTPAKARPSFTLPSTGRKPSTCPTSFTEACPPKGSRSRPAVFGQHHPEDGMANVVHA